MAVSATTSTSTASVSNGIGGLVSGMNTDELVDKMTQISQDKILKQQQKLQKLQWKQTAYREVTTALTDFKKTYFDSLSKTNFRSTAFFNAAKATASSESITATATSAASAGTITINSISQLATSQKITSSGTVSKALSGTLTETGTLTDTEITTLLSELKDKSISLTMDGKTRTITFDSTFIDAASTPAPTAELLESTFQDAIDKAFGKNSSGLSLLDVSISGNSLSFSAPTSKVVMGGDTDALSTLGFTNGQSNKIVLGSSLANLALNTSLSGSSFAFSINEVDFTFSSTDSLEKVISAVNSSSAGVTISYSSVSDKFAVTANETGSGDNIRISQTSGNLLNSLLGTEPFTGTAGKNAELTIDGQSIVRTSNNFTLDGVNINLLETTATGADPITIKIAGDSSSLLDPIVKFVDDYNSIMDKLNGYLKDTADRDYQPLSDEQKAEMTESQISDWETKSKAGILANDPALRSIATSLQSMIYSPGVEGGLSLYNIGITSAGYAENGKLQIDETKLKDALETKSFEIKDLFTATDGLSNKMNTILTKAVETKGVKGSRGTLIDLAGIALTTSETQNSINDKMETVNDLISTLKDRLEDEQDRYWSKFTAMESALQSFNQQSSMITSFFSSN